MATVSKTFVLSNDTAAQRLWTFFKGNWRQMAEAGKPLSVTVAEFKAKRSGKQNRRYWALLNEIEANAWLDGRQFSAQAWHAWFAAQFIGCEDLPGGGTVAISTTTLNVEEFAAYMTRIEVYAATELGVELT